MEDKLVTIIVPVYDVEPYLRECIESLLVQTYHRLEIILIDDGSTDNSGFICDEYKGLDSRIKVIHKENGGLSDARNIGLEASNGDYISFVDSDDYVSPCFIETFVKALELGDCEVAAVKAASDFWDEDEYRPQLVRDVSECKMFFVDSRDALEKMLYMRIPTGAQFKMYSKEIWLDIRFPKGYLYEDIATTYKTFLVSKKIALIESNIYAYRKRKDSIIRQEFTNKKLTAINVFDQLINDTDLKEAKLENAAASRVYSMLYSVFLQIPENDIDTQKLVWKKLKTVQKIVLFDNSKYVRKKNKMAAIISIFGMRVSFVIGRSFGQSIFKGTSK